MRYGAPLGRVNHDGGAVAHGMRWTLQHVRLNMGGYDRGGAYWGQGARLYWAAATGLDGNEVSFYFRAKDREAAKAHVRAKYPHAKFG